MNTFFLCSAVAGVLLLVATHAHAATLTVTTLKDSGPGSLRAAITRANRKPGADTIIFARKVRGTLDIASALPDLASHITIKGPGRDTLNVRRTGKAHYRIFTVTKSGKVALSGLTLSNGSVVAVTAPTPKRGVGGGISNEGLLEMKGCTVTGNQASEGGGGVFNSSDQNGWGLLLTNCLVTNNRCLNLKPHGRINGGGGLLIAREGGEASAKVTGCTFAGNISEDVSDDGKQYGNGGAISTGPLGAYIFESTLSDNIAHGRGGALYSAETKSAGFGVWGCAFINNRASEGGGVYADAPDGQIELQGCTLSGNKATSKAGAVAANGMCVSLYNCTIVNNVAPQQAGVSTVYRPRISNCIIVGNLLPSGSPGNDISILSDKTAPEQSRKDEGYNLIGRGDAASLAFFNRRGERCNVTLEELKLGPLAYNGGPTKTYALRPGSIAIGNARYRALSDPKGAEPSGRGDIGAFQTIKPKSSELTVD